VPLYRFSDFTLSTRTRRLIRDGQPLPLIPRYLDLLIFLIERRREAVHRREIFDRVWTDVIVSDSALSQAVRTLRRTLGDDPREPRFIRTVSRHGYQFTWPDVIEGPDDDAPDSPPGVTTAESEQARQKLGASIAALMAGALQACRGSAVAGGAAGIAGGLALVVSPSSSATSAVVPVLLLVGGAAGAAGGLGVGAGLAFAESSSRLRNVVGLTGGAALGGGTIGVLVEWLMRTGLGTIVGVRLSIGGAVEGLTIGAAAGLGYALARRLRAGRMTLPCRWAAVATSCAVAALLLAWSGRPLVGGTLHEIARAARGSQVSLAPLGRLVGEPEFGPLSQSLIAACEGGLFGLGVAAGLFLRR
jgi:DNA-binding winged helix-turn-helix (wHTH) protein